MNTLNPFRRRRHGHRVGDAPTGMPPGHSSSLLLQPVGDPQTAPACRACSREDYGACTCPEDCGWLSCTGGWRDAPPAESHGIATPEILAELVAQAQAQAEAETATDVRIPAYVPQPPPIRRVGPAPEPPSAPFSGISALWVRQIRYPDPADLSYYQARDYRETLRHIGKATGTSTSLEDTMAWPVPALEVGTEPAA